MARPPSAPDYEKLLKKILPLDHVKDLLTEVCGAKGIYS